MALSDLEAKVTTTAAQFWAFSNLHRHATRVVAGVVAGLLIAKFVFHL